MEGQSKKEILLFLQFLQVCDQLQTNGISKRFDAQRRDFAHIVDFSTQIKMLVNFVYLTKQEVDISLFKGTSKHISQIVYLESQETLKKV